MPRKVYLLVLTILLIWTTGPCGQTAEAGREAVADSLYRDWGDTLATGAKAARPSVEDLKVIKREHKYRQQVGLALFMMAFVAIMLTTTDALNPR